LAKIGIAGLLMLGAIGCSSEPEPIVEQGAQGDKGGLMDQQIPPKFVVGDVPQSILDVKTKNDFIYDTVQTIAPEWTVPGLVDSHLNLTGS